MEMLRWGQVQPHAPTSLPPTCAVCFGDQQHGVEDLILILLIQDFALAEVGGQLRWRDGATQFVTFALQLLPQRLHIVTCPVFHPFPLKSGKTSLNVLILTTTAGGEIASCGCCQTHLSSFQTFENGQIGKWIESRNRNVIYFRFWGPTSWHVLVYLWALNLFLI